MDPIYGPISKRFYENPDEFNEAFAKAWYKLTHRDMGPVSRYLGPEVAKPQLLAGPGSRGRITQLIDDGTSPRSRARFSARACRSPQLVSTAWASASTFRGTATSAAAPTVRAIRLAPQKDWEVNQPDQAGEGAWDSWKRIQSETSTAPGRERRSRSPT